MVLSKKECKYASCYCEENVYILCSTLLQTGQAASFDELFVVFISNPGKKVPLWRQQSSSQTGGLVVWDYHVLLVQHRRSPATSTNDQQQEQPGSEVLVWDLDSSLPFPCPGHVYAREALQPLLMQSLPPGLGRCPTPQDLTAKMRQGQVVLKDGSPPAPWPPIKSPTSDTSHNLHIYWTVDPASCCSQQALQQMLRNSTAYAASHRGQSIQYGLTVNEADFMRAVLGSSIDP